MLVISLESQMIIEELSGNISNSLTVITDSVELFLYQVDSRT